VLGAYDEPDVEPDVSVTSSAAVRLRERLAAAPLVLRARPAGDRPGAVSCCPAECAGMTAASPMARAHWNTGVLLSVSWPCACVCAAARAASAAGASAGCAALLSPEGPAVAALARRARRLRVARLRAALRLAMQDLPRGPVQKPQNRAGWVSSHCHDATATTAKPFFVFAEASKHNSNHSVKQKVQLSHSSASIPHDINMRADALPPPHEPKVRTRSGDTV